MRRRRTRARGIHRVQRLHAASAEHALADLGASEPHDFSAHGGPGVRRPRRRERRMRAGRACERDR
jgi:hypothetical protein